MVKNRSAQGQGNGDGEIVVNRESLRYRTECRRERRRIKEGEEGLSLKSEGAAGIVCDRCVLDKLLAWSPA